jgi:hypothetical protein
MEDGGLGFEEYRKSELRTLPVVRQQALATLADQPQWPYRSLQRPLGSKPRSWGLFGNKLVNSWAAIEPTTKAEFALCSGLLEGNFNVGGGVKGKQICPSYFRTRP